MQMDREHLFKEMDELFPKVVKPKGISMSFHKIGCIHCEELRKDLAHVNGAFPEEELRTIYDELSCLSSEGLLWVMPAYLKYIIGTEASLESDEVEIEFFIYNFSPELKYQKETISRLGSLSKSQLSFISKVFEWLSSFTYWREWHGEDLERAKLFLNNIDA